MLLTAGMLVGGLGLFLLAVNMITDGLRLGAGEALREILARYTRTPMRGVLSGILVTGVVLSSSAVTVATIGFVNAGLLTLSQSLGVVYGANIGTTMIGWLVAVAGFNLKLEALALPLVGLGMLARLVRGGTRIGAVGEAVAGFGLFFIGVDVLRGAFASFADAVDVTTFAPTGGAGLLLYVLLGFLVTLLTQSSAAAIALTLTAVSGGALPLNAGAALVIGANVGTTSTAVLASIGATANARRVAAAHVVFNVVTGLVALALLPLLLWSVQSAGSVLRLGPTPVVALALFHSVFNLLGVALMWPLTPRLANLLAHRFVTPSEALARPVHLDRTVLVTPTLAMEALKLELLRAMEMAREVALHAINAEMPPGADTRERLRGLRGLLGAVQDFVAEVEADRLPPGTAETLPLLLRISNYLEDVADLTEGLETHLGDLGAASRSAVAGSVEEFRSRVAAQLSRSAPESPGFDRLRLNQEFLALEQRWHTLKDEVLTAASRKALPLGRVNGALDALRTSLRLAEQLTKAAMRMHTLMPRQAEQPAAQH